MSGNLKGTNDLGTKNLGINNSGKLLGLKDSVVALSTAAILSVVSPGEVKASTKNGLSGLDHTIQLAQADTNGEVNARLESLGVKVEQPKANNDNDAFDEKNFKLDLEEYLGKNSKEFAEMPADKKNIFSNTFSQLLRDNGKTYEKTFKKSGKIEVVDTLKDIKFLMRDYVMFLHNLDFKVRNAVPSYEKLLKNFQDYKLGGLKVDDSIMYTIYGMKIFAEQVDFFRNEIDNKPGVPSEKYAKQGESLKVILANLEAEIKQTQEERKQTQEERKQTQEERKQTQEERKKIQAEIEVLRIVIKGLEAMSRVK